MEWSDGGPVTVERTSTHRFTSKHVGDELEVTIALPALYDEAAGHHPVLYLIDPSFFALVAVAFTRGAELFDFGRFPPIVVVGIGYADADILDVMSKRTRDLTPTDAPFPDALEIPFPLAHGSGGASAFLDAIVEEVIPEVESRLRTDPAERILAGHSFGGLFGLHTLLTRPEAFSRYLLGSPSIWWDDRAVLTTEAEYASTHDDLRASVYLAVGEREEAEPDRTWPPHTDAEREATHMVANVHELGARLRGRAYPSLQLRVDELADEHHTTMFLSAITRGLLYFYGRTASGDPLP